MRFITYNVNSVSARLPRLLALLERYEPDIVCIQETKVSPDAFPHMPLEAAGYRAADCSGGRWAGVAILARADHDLTDISTGLADVAAPEEARWVEADVGGIRVVSAYVPNGQAPGTEPFAQKLRFLDAMRVRAATLAAGPAVIAGDLNVCPTDLDVWSPAEIHGGTHITPDERGRLQRVLENGFVDSFRTLHPEEPGYTWWDYRAGHFHKGFGLRIDLALFSQTLAPRLAAAVVERAFRKPSTVPESKPSDHAPLIVDLS